MKPDYLWDRSGEPDPELQKLEAQLSRFRYDRPLSDFPAMAQDPAEGRRAWFPGLTWRFGISLAAAAVAVSVLAVGGRWWYLNSLPAYDVVSLQGAPRVGNSGISTRGRLTVGRWLETDTFARAQIAIGAIGRVEVGPNSRVGLVKAQPTEHRLSIEYGSIHALIWAPPRMFFVDTPAAQAIDLGCEYTLDVGEDGEGELRVLSGWVAFERDGRESFVPRRFGCRMRPGFGPGTPFRLAAPERLRQSLDRLDFERGSSDLRRGWLSTLLEASRPEDSVTLWHLLRRCEESERGRIFDRLAEVVPPPEGVTREGVLRVDWRMLDLWWDRLGIGGADWWRMWKGPVPGSR